MMGASDVISYLDMSSEWCFCVLFIKPCHQRRLNAHAAIPTQLDEGLHYVYTYCDESLHMEGSKMLKAVVGALRTHWYPTFCTGRWFHAWQMFQLSQSNQLNKLMLPIMMLNKWNMDRCRWRGQRTQC